MDCIPRCRVCVVAGTCNRSQVPATPMPKPVRPSVSQYVAARAVVEAELRPYMHLTCGCLTTSDEQRFYDVWRPRPHHYWCPTHTKWVKIVAENKPEVLPAEPMF